MVSVQRVKISPDPLRDCEGRPQMDTDRGIDDVINLVDDPGGMGKHALVQVKFVKA